MRDLPFSLRQLQYVVSIAEHGGFRKAAEACHVAQPALSIQVGRLEDALGVPLFERGARVMPTPAGQVLVAKMQAILLAIDDLQSAARQLRDPLRGRMRIGAIQTVAPYLLPDVVPAVRAAFPDLEVHWTTGRTAGLMADLHEGRLDAAIVALGRGVDDVDHAIVAQDPFVLAIAREHPLAAVDRPTPASLAGCAVHLLEDGHCFAGQTRDVCVAVGAIEPAFRSTDLTTLVQMVASAGGVTLLPAMAVAVENRREELVLRDLGPDGPARTVALAWRPSSPLGPALRQVAAVMHAAHLSDAD